MARATTLQINLLGNASHCMN